MEEPGYSKDTSARTLIIKEKADGNVLSALRSHFLGSAPSGSAAKRVSNSLQ